MAVDYSSIVIGSRAAGLGLRDEDERRRRSFERTAQQQLPSAPDPIGRAESSLSPDEEQSIVRQAGDLALDGVGAVGNLIDLPASVFRDILTWAPGGPSPRNPIDQLAPWNWTSSRGRITGQEFLEDYGIIDNPENQSTAGAIGRFGAGLAFEIATDPLTYLSFGATSMLKGAGKGAIAARSLKKVGLLDNVDLYASAGKLGKRETMLSKSAKDVLDSPLIASRDASGKATKLAKESFDEAVVSDKSFKKLSEGKTDSEKLKLLDEVREATLGEGAMRFGAFGRGVNFAPGLAPGMDKLGKRVRYSAPVVAAAARLSKTNEKLYTAESQKAMRKYLAEQQGAFVAARQRMYDNLRVMDPILNDFEGLSGEALNAKRNEVAFQLTRYMEDIGRKRKQPVELTDGTIEQPPSIFSSSRDELFEESRDSYKDRFLGELRSKVQSKDKVNQAVDQEVYDRVEAVIRSGEDGAVGVADDMKDALDELIVQASGFQDIEQFVDPFATYLPRIRQTSRGILTGSEKSRKAFDPENPLRMKRKDEYRNIPGGTEAIQRMSIDPEFAGVYARRVKETTKVDPNERMSLLSKFKAKYKDVLSPDGGNTYPGKVEDLFDAITKRNRIDVERAVPIFGVNPAESSLKALELAYKAKAQAEMYRNVIRDTMYVQSVPGGRFEAAARRTFGTTQETDRALTAAESLARQLADSKEMLEEEVSRRIVIGSRGDGPSVARTSDDVGGGTPPGSVAPDGGGTPPGSVAPDGGGTPPGSVAPDGGGTAAVTPSTPPPNYSQYTQASDQWEGFFEPAEGAAKSKENVNGKEVEVELYNPESDQISFFNDAGELEDIPRPSREAVPESVEDVAGKADDALGDGSFTEFDRFVSDEAKRNISEDPELAQFLANLTDDQIAGIAEGYGVNKLREFARQFGIKPKGKKRAEVIASMRSAASEVLGRQAPTSEPSVFARLIDSAIDGTREALEQTGYFIGKDGSGNTFSVLVPDDARDGLYGVLTRQKGKQDASKSLTTSLRSFSDSNELRASSKDLGQQGELHEFLLEDGSTVSVSHGFMEAVSQLGYDGVDYKFAPQRKGSGRGVNMVAVKDGQVVGFTAAKVKENAAAAKVRKARQSSASDPFTPELTGSEIDEKVNDVLSGHRAGSDALEIEELNRVPYRESVEAVVRTLAVAKDWLPTAELSRLGPSAQRVLGKLRDSEQVTIAYDKTGNVYHALADKKLGKELKYDFDDFPKSQTENLSQKVKDEEARKFISSAIGDIDLGVLETKAGLTRIPTTRMLNASDAVQTEAAQMLLDKSPAFLGSYLKELKSTLPKVTNDATRANLERFIKAAEKVREKTKLVDEVRDKAPFIGTENRARLFVAVSNLLGSDENAALALAATEATAKTWARATGKNPDDYYKSLVAVDVVGNLGGARGLMVSPKMDVVGRENWVAAIKFSKDADVSTVIHEMAHYAEKFLSEIDPELGRLANEAVGAADSNWNKAQKELFAEGLERYIAEGVAPTQELASVYEKIKQWIIDVYRGMPKANINDNLREVYRRMQGGDPNDYKKATDTVSPEPPGIIDNSNAGIIDNADAVDGDQLGLFGESQRAATTSKPIKGSSSASQSQLFDTEVRTEVDREGNILEEGQLFGDSASNPGDAFVDYEPGSAGRPRQKPRAVVSQENKWKIANAIGVSIQKLTSKGNWHKKGGKRIEGEIVQDTVESILREARDNLEETEEFGILDALIQSHTGTPYQTLLRYVREAKRNAGGDYDLMKLDEVAKEMEQGVFKTDNPEHEIFDALLAVPTRVTKNGIHIDKDKFTVPGTQTRRDIYDDDVVNHAVNTGMLTEEAIFPPKTKYDPTSFDPAELGDDAEEFFQRSVDDTETLYQRPVDDSDIDPYRESLWSHPGGVQEIGSADTSRKQVAATFTNPKSPAYNKFLPGTINADIGGGFWDMATESLDRIGVKNIIYDPYNRSSEWNKNAIRQIAGGQADTATVNNVLNVIAEESAREKVIAQAADAVKDDGTAYFKIYEGGKSDQVKGPRVTKSKGGEAESWQNFFKAKVYVPEIQKHFGSVEVAGEYIVAKNPKKGAYVELETLYQQGNQRVIDEIGGAAGDPAVRVDMPRRDFLNAPNYNKTYIQALKEPTGEDFSSAIGSIYSEHLKDISPELDTHAQVLYGAKGGDWSSLSEVDGVVKTAREHLSDDFAKYARGEMKPPIGMGGYFDGLFSMVKDVVSRNPDSGRNYKIRKFFGDVLNRPFSHNDVRLSEINAKLKSKGDVASRRMDALLTPVEREQANRNVLRQRFEQRKSTSGDSIDNIDQQLADPEVIADPAKVRELKRRRRNLVQIQGMDADQFMDDVDQIRITEPTKNSHLGLGFDVGVKERLTQVKVPRWVADDLYKMEEGLNYLEDDWNIGSIIKWYDGYGSLFKTGVTSLNIGFHTRNFFSGFVQNMLNDVHDPRYSALDPRRFTRPYNDGRQMMYGKPVEGANKIASYEGMSDLEATEAIARDLLAHGVIEQPGSYRDIAGSGSSSISSQLLGPMKQVKVGTKTIGGKQSDNIYQFVRGRAPFGPTPITQQAAKQQKASRRAMTAIADFYRKFEDGSRAVGDVVEFQHRVGGFIALRRQGYSASEAARRINLLHVDYSNLSQMEKEYLRRAIPFYSFSRGMAKYLSEELVTRPGGPVAQTIRAQNRSRDRDVSTPTYVSKGLSIPVGMSADGTRHFITGLGLMHEQPVQQIAPFLRLDPGRSAFTVLSNMNPVPKSFLELAFDESSFQEGVSGGVDLDDARPPVGQMLTNLMDREDEEPVRLGKAFEVLAGSSPLSRYIKTVSQMSDDRKGVVGRYVAPLTGFRVTSVSPERQDAVTRERAEEYLQNIGARQFVKRYIPEDVYNRLSPEDKQVADKYLALIELISKRGKERRKAEQLLETKEEEKGLVDGR